MPEKGIAGVGEQLLAGLRVLDQHQPDVRQVEFDRIHDADRDHLVPLAQCGQRRSPVDVADEVGVPASQLDAYVPQWNREAIENIFATHLEDWPALLRSLQSLATDVRRHGAPSVAMNNPGN